MPSGIEFYAGAPIDVESEILVGRCLDEKLTGPAVILANVILAGRQIDFVVATAATTLLVEAKSSFWPLRGGQNGDWEVLLPQGPRKTRNAYRQALDAGHALRDVISRWRGSSVGYFNTAVIYTPKIPEGSSLNGADHKVSIIGLAELRTTLNDATGCALGLEEWRLFAQHMKLKRIHKFEELIDPSHSKLRELLDQYTGECALYCGSIAQQWVTDPTLPDLEGLSAEPALFVGGKSGCGKSLLAYSLSALTSKRGGVSVVIAGKAFNGNWRQTLAREIALLAPTNPEKLLASARRHERDILFVLDALNEIALADREYAVRGLMALARRYQARIILTSNSNVDLAIPASVRKIDLPEPRQELKEAIAIKVTGGELNQATRDLLRAVRTGLESKLVGAVGVDGAKKSRFELFMMYARDRLGHAAPDALRGLSALAEKLVNGLAFSTGARNYERILNEENCSQEIAGQLRSAGLIENRGSRVSFTHELFLQAFGAEAIVRTIGNDPEKVLIALEEPRNADRRIMLVGALDEPSLIEAVLSRTADELILHSAATGECGLMARDVTLSLLNDVLRLAHQEMTTMVTEVVAEGEWPTLEFLNSRAWTVAETARLTTVGKLAISGELFDHVMSLSAHTDQKMESERLRLNGLARAGGRKANMRSPLFGRIHIFQRGLGYERIIASMNRIWGGTSQINPTRIAQLLDSTNVGNSQAYLLIKFIRQGSPTDDLCLAFASAIGRLWPTAPYHLKLDLLDGAHYLGRVSEVAKKELISFISGVATSDDHIFITTSAIDALRALGALESDGEEARAGIREQLQMLVASSNEPILFPAAWGAYTSRFDHPYDWIYYEEWERLDPAARAELLRMAVMGADGRFSFFLNVALTDLADLREANDLQTFRRFANVPEADHPMPQDAMRVFAVAHLALGMHGDHEHEAITASTAEEILGLAGRLLRWLSDKTADENSKKAAIESIWRSLDQHLPALTIGVLAQLDEAIQLWDGGTLKVFGRHSLSKSSPSSALRLARQVLDSEEMTVGYFKYPEAQRGYQFAISIVAEHGDLSDLQRLRRLAATARGEAAIRVLEQLEKRL